MMVNLYVKLSEKFSCALKTEALCYRNLKMPSSVSRAINLRYLIKHRTLEIECPDQTIKPANHIKQLRRRLVWHKARAAAGGLNLETRQNAGK